VCEGRENRKKSTARVLMAVERPHGAVGSVKKAPFLTYAVKNKIRPGRRAAKKVREKS
jgi:hypothetical protein